MTVRNFENGVWQQCVLEILNNSVQRTEMIMKLLIPA